MIFPEMRKNYPDPKKRIIAGIKRLIIKMEIIIGKVNQFLIFLY